MIDPQFALSRNLHDARCDAHIIEGIIKFHSKGKTEEEFRLLQRHRKTLLNEFHKNQKNIDCLDFLIFKLGQENTLPTMSRTHV